MSFSVTILGCASAKPTANRHPSAQAVNIHEQYYLVDAGEGVQQQLVRAGINPLKLRAVFLSHLHGDHLFGLFPLLSTLGLYGRCTPLPVYAPAPFGELLACHLKYLDRDLPYAVEWHEVDTTQHALLMENRTLEVWSIPLRHRVPCAGVLFREKEPPLNVDKFKFKAAADGQESTNELELELTEMKGSDDLERLEKIVYTVTATSMSNVTLRPKQYLLVKNIFIEIPNGINLSL